MKFRPLILLLPLAGIPPAASAKTLSVGPLPPSPFTDTETATNVPINRIRSDIRNLSLRFAPDHSADCAREVAFGIDRNGDGKLDFEETELLLGLHSENLFIEDVTGCRLFLEPLPETMDGGNSLVDIRWTINRTKGVRLFSASCGNAHVFAFLSRTVPPWLFNADWNLMRIVRRGAHHHSDWMTCDIRYERFAVLVR